MTTKTLQGLLVTIVMALVAGCGGGDGATGVAGPPGPPGPPGPTGPAGPPGETPVTSLPGLVVTIASVTGGSGPNGNVRAGDTISVTFSAKTGTGGNVDVSKLDAGSIFVSGPTSNYQRVVLPQADVPTRAVSNGNGSWTYQFAAPVPAQFAAPVNDTASFGAADGELAGQALLDGTYTVGLELQKGYTINGAALRDHGLATRDFLVGAASVLTAHEVTTDGNCNTCHSNLRAHDGTRQGVRTCVLCHTAGAEDGNTATVAGGTPGVSVDFKVMIHKIHNAKFLPSVNGVGTNLDGSRDYARTPQRLEYMGAEGEVTDFSEVAFPVNPSAYVSFLFDTAGTTYTGTGGNGPMPRDLGYTSLTASQKFQDDKLRVGAVACAKCHGDPDGSGPLPAPAQGDLHASNLSRSACGSCHDDVDWTRPYTANGSTMPADQQGSGCSTCHVSGGTAPAVASAHLHPYLDPARNTGIAVNLTGVSGGSGPGGKHAVGDPVLATFSVRDNAGTDLQINALTRFQMIVVGPTENRQILQPNLNPFDFAFRKSTPFTGNGTVSAPVVAASAVAQTLAVVFTGDNIFDVVGSVSGTLLSGGTVPNGGGNTGALTTAGVTYTITDGSTNFVAGDRLYLEVMPLAAAYTVNVPTDVALERVTAATGAAQVVSLANVPLYWGRQVVFERTAIQAGTTLATAAQSLVRFVVADTAAVPGIAVGDRVVLDADTASEEYVQVGRIQTSDDRSGADLGAADQFWFTTPLRYAHGAGSSIQEVTLASKREGIAYVVLDASIGEITLAAGQFVAGNPVVVSYRSHFRFGTRRAAGEPMFAVFGAPIADSEDFEASWGDWKGLSFLDGTYTVGMWANRDFGVTAFGETTTYRMMALPATRSFLFGNATTLSTHKIIESEAACNNCHEEVVAHGFGRRGLDTCMLCHSSPGVEDGPKYSYSSWYTGPTAGVSMDFRQLLHKLHMGRDLKNANDYKAIGVFLGVPYNFGVADIGFPAAPGGTANCRLCHGNDTWKEPRPRLHPDSIVPTRVWRAACASCHDSAVTTAHIDQNTALGVETCAVCHGGGRVSDVKVVHHTN